MISMSEKKLLPEEDLSGVARADPPQTLINFTEMDFTEVA